MSNTKKSHTDRDQRRVILSVAFITVEVGSFEVSREPPHVKSPTTVFPIIFHGDNISVSIAQKWSEVTYISPFAVSVFVGRAVLEARNEELNTGLVREEGVVKPSDAGRVCRVNLYEQESKVDGVWEADPWGDEKSKAQVELLTET